MSRSITESLTALENARNDIVDALNSKIEGGGIEKSLKISEVAEKINSIEVGGGSASTPFTYIDYIEYNGKQYTDNFSGITFTDYGQGGNLIFKIKAKKLVFFVNIPNNLTAEPQLYGNNGLRENTEYTFKFPIDYLSDLDGIPIVISDTGNYDETYHQPDFFLIYYNYAGE